MTREEFTEIYDLVLKEKSVELKFNPLIDEQPYIKREATLSLPSEFFDVSKVIENGAEKHGLDSWLNPGVFQFNKRLQSIFRHTLKVAGLWNNEHLTDKELISIITVLRLLDEAQFKTSNLLDKESGLSHMLHGLCNFAMFHTVIERGILKGKMDE